MNKDTILYKKIKGLKSAYTSHHVTQLLSTTLMISERTLFRYILNVNDIPADKAILLYEGIGLTIADIKHDLKISSDHENGELIRKLEALDIQ